MFGKGKTAKGFAGASKFRVRCRVEITPFQGEVMPSACMAADVAASHPPPPSRGFHHVLFLSQNTEPTSGASAAPALRLCSSSRSGTGDPTSLGLVFFLNPAGQRVAEHSCCGSCSAAQLAHLCSVTSTCAMGLHRAGSAAGAASPASLTWDIPLPVCVGRVGAHPAGCQGPAHPAGTLQLGFTWRTNICAGPAGACLFCSHTSRGSDSPVTLLPVLPEPPR